MIGASLGRQIMITVIMTDARPMIDTRKGGG